MTQPTSAPDAPTPKTRLPLILVSLLRDPGLWLYGAVTLLGAPYFLKRKRGWQRKSPASREFDPARWTLRFPPATAPHPSGAPRPPASGPRVMIFAQGWGEVETLKPLLLALRAARPDVRLLFTAKHREGIAPAAALSDEAIVPLPFDNTLSVARWLALTRPDVALFYEQFSYGALLRALWQRRVPFVIIHARNAHLVADSAFDLRFKKWQLRGLRAICLSAPDREPFLRQVMPKSGQIHVVGSLKFPHQKPRMTPEREADLRAWIETGAQGAPLLAAGSTRATEEAFVLDAWQKVRAQAPNQAPNQAPVLLIAPRQLHRVPEVVELLRARGIHFAQRSQPSADTGKVEVLLLDTLGELGAAYGWARGAFVGGTIKGASHNVAEPLVWGIPVAFGPRTGNFEIEQRLCLETGAGFRVQTPDELAAHWTEIVNSPALRAALGAKADALVEAQRGAFDRTLQVLIDAVDAATPHYA